MVRREFLGVFFLFYGKIKKREINKSILYLFVCTRMVSSFGRGTHRNKIDKSILFLFVCTRTTYGGSDAAFVKRKNKFFLSPHLHP